MQDEDYFDREYFRLTGGKRRYLAYLVGLLGRVVAPGARVLDVGAGLGFFVAASQSAGFEAWGLEASRRAAREARRGGLARIVRGDAEQTLPFRDGSFAAITLFDLIEHLADPAALLAECRRLLRPNGRLFVITLNAGSLARPLLGRRWSFHLDPTHKTLFSKRSLAAAALGAGFRVERATTLSNFCSVGEGNAWLKPLRVIGRVITTPWLGDSLLLVAVNDGPDPGAGPSATKR